MRKFELMFLLGWCIVLPSLSVGCSRRAADAGSSEVKSLDYGGGEDRFYGNHAELALVSLAHKNFSDETQFEQEFISDSSGEKRVCGVATIGGLPKKYYFSLNYGLSVSPSPELWDRNCRGGWTPGRGK